ncbi:queuine tRNA-ribosyltransferase [compost metagenome]
MRHLFIAGELLVHRLLTIHNLFYYGQLVSEARDVVRADRYDAWAAERLAAMGAGEASEGA